MSGIVLGNGTAASAEATIDTNGDLHVRTPQTEVNAGFAQASAEIDAGTVTGSRYVRALEASADFRLRTGHDVTMFNMAFEGANVAQDRIQQSTTTMSIGQTGGFLTLNSGAITTTTTNASIRTYRTFPVFGTYPTYVEMWIKPVNETATNSVKEFGVGFVSAASAPTDGVFFRYNTAGQLQCVLSYSGTETTTNISSPTTNQVHHFLISIHSEEVEFWINDVLQAEMSTPAAYPSPMSAMEQPFFARVYNSGTSSTAPQLSLGRLEVTLGDMGNGRLWPHIMAGMGGGADRIQPGTASGPTVSRGTGANGWPASATARIAGTWTATSAPALNSLGGLFTTPAISTLTSDADYPIFAYQNPAGAASVPGKTLYVTGVRVGEGCATAAASTNSIVLSYGCSAGSTAAATSTADSATAVGLHIVPLGHHAFGATAALGSASPGFNVDFSGGPLVVAPGQFFVVICRPVGTVTSNTLVVTSSVTVVGYYE